MKVKLLLFFIIFFGLYLRLVNLSEWFHFEMDEEVIAWKVRQFVQAGKPFLIGGGTPFGIHLGPAFYYLSAIPLWFSKLDPIGWGWLAAAAGAFTIWLCFVAGKLLYNRKVGIIAALFWSTSFIAAMSDRHWWPLVLDPALSLLVLISLHNILNNKKRWWIILGIVLAVAWQTDLTVLPLFLISMIVGIIRFKKEAKFIFLSAFIVLISLLPLVVFEVRHPGANIGQLFSYRFGDQVSISRNTVVSSLRIIPTSLGRLLFPTDHDSNISRVYSWCASVAAERKLEMPFRSILIAIGIMTFPLLRSSVIARSPDPGSGRRGNLGPKAHQSMADTLNTDCHDPHACPLRSEASRTGRSDGFRNDLETSSKSLISNKLLTLFFAAGTAGLLLFGLVGGNLFEFYPAVLYPIFLLSAAAMLGSFRDSHRFITTAIIIGIVTINLSVFYSARHPYGLAIKQEAISWAIQMVGGQPFALESISKCNRYDGIRYLFMLEKHEPTLSFMDPNLFWLYDQPPATEYPDTLVVFATPGDLTSGDQGRYNILSGQAFARKTFGELEVLVVNNENHQFQIDF